MTLESPEMASFSASKGDLLKLALDQVGGGIFPSLLSFKTLASSKQLESFQDT
jgi:hypothetical protein